MILEGGRKNPRSLQGRKKDCIIFSRGSVCHSQLCVFLAVFRWKAQFSSIVLAPINPPAWSADLSQGFLQHASTGKTLWRRERGEGESWNVSPKLILLPPSFYLNFILLQKGLGRGGGGGAERTEEMKVWSGAFAFVLGQQAEHALLWRIIC